MKLSAPSALVLNYINRCLTYDPLTGIVSKDGKPLGNKNRCHIQLNLSLDSKYEGCYLHYPVRAHQVAWYLHYGEWAPIAIDHIDGDGTNNRIANLRLATSAQNAQNVRKRTAKKTSSRYKGVSSRGNNYRAYIRCEGRRYHLGTFPSEELAALAYNVKAQELFGEFASLNMVDC